MPLIVLAPTISLFEVGLSNVQCEMPTPMGTWSGRQSSLPASYVGPDCPGHGLDLPHIGFSAVVQAHEHYHHFSETVCAHWVAHSLLRVHTEAR